MNSNLNWKNYFRLNGFVLEPNAIIYLTEIFSNQDFDKCAHIADKIISSFLDLNLPNNRISFEHIKQSMNVGVEETNLLKLFQIIDAFNIPILLFDCNSKKYIMDEVSNGKPIFSKLFSDSAKMKSRVLRDRYQMIYQRLIRNDKSFVYHNSLKQITNVVTFGSTTNNCIILGMLSKLREDHWSLEDETGIVEINLDNTKYHKGLIIEGSFVLAEGKIEDRLFYVDTIGMPTIEPAARSRLAINDKINYFGGLPANNGIKSCKQITNLMQTELNEKSLIFASDIFLDREIVIRKLKILFQGYKVTKPEAFIFCGDFLSPSTTWMDISEKLKLLKESIKNVVKSFAMFPDLALNSYLVFVPGPRDLFQGTSSTLPYSSFSSSYLLEGVFNSLPNYSESNINNLKDRIIFATNPCRMTFYDKEIVVFRQSIMQKLYPHRIYIPNENYQLEEIPQIKDSLDDPIRSVAMNNSQPTDIDTAAKKVNRHFLEKNLVWTILSQAHLVPLPLHLSPVDCQFDNAFHLFPLPDLLVMSDPESSSFNFQLSGCSVINPPKFSGSDDFPFHIYLPLKNEVQNCSVNV